MDLMGVLRACVRRWYVVLPLLIIAVWYPYRTYASVKPVYYASGVMGVALPNFQTPYRADGVPVGKNGLLENGGSVVLLNMVVLGLGQPDVKQKVVELGGEPNFKVRMFPPDVTSNIAQYQLPLIMVEATEPDPESATKTVEVVAQQAGEVLRSLQQQAAVPNDQMATVITVSPPHAVGGMPSRTKSALILLAAGVGVALLAGVLVDGLLLRIGRRRDTPIRDQREDLAGANGNDGLAVEKETASTVPAK